MIKSRAALPVQTPVGAAVAVVLRLIIVPAATTPTVSILSFCNLISPYRGPKASVGDLAYKRTSLTGWGLVLYGRTTYRASFKSGGFISCRSIE